MGKMSFSKILKRRTKTPDLSTIDEGSTLSLSIDGLANSTGSTPSSSKAGFPVPVAHWRPAIRRTGRSKLFYPRPRIYFYRADSGGVGRELVYNEALMEWRTGDEDVLGEGAPLSVLERGGICSVICKLQKTILERFRAMRKDKKIEKKY